MAKLGFTRREQQIMETVYRLGEATVAEILAGVPDPPSYSSVRALIGVLVEKGHLRHREDGPRYVYSPTAPRSKASADAVKRVMNTFFGGSASAAVSALLGASRRPLSKEELDQLTALIEAERKKAK